jgi:Skp family chaperone for outer membrane proteins
MKKLLFPLIMVACLVAGGARAAGDMVFIDLQEVFKHFYKTELARDQIQQQESDIKLERETMESEITGMKEEIEVLRADSRDDTLSDEVRASKRDLLEEKLVELQTRDQEIIDYARLRKQQLEQQNARMSLKLFDEIQSVINDHGKEMGYAAILDRSAQSRSGTQAVLYVDTARDITSELLAVLNEGHEKSAVKEFSPDMEQ